MAAASLSPALRLGCTASVVSTILAAVAKHGTIGLMRSMHSALTRQDIPVRINAIAPSWTATGMVMEQVFKKFGVYTQSSDVVARAAAMLMADESRSGHLIHVDRGVYKEVDEAYLLPAFDSLMHKDTANEDDTFWRVAEAYAEASKQNAQAAA
ncbi:hypothetical protein NUW58_g9174 [Xylaria curta]|uniref:Uncharacterized protein n=1 Tax=Xylaria curta TaxID=42375 RepID=A0ACC1N1Y2_9PEZI|nr:hypothetical protein NUW58_g9174 [Xylaria curta]